MPIARTGMCAEAAAATSCNDHPSSFRPIALQELAPYFYMPVAGFHLPIKDKMQTFLFVKKQGILL